MSLSKSVKSLCAWYAQAHRKLPWRETSDPYRIWISEVMLQQTQVATVIPYYERFLKLFPNVRALANAEEGDVLTAWAGLGYYSRARNLKRGAEFLTKNRNGIFPQTREEILEIPGIGPYTAGAILSIAFDLPVAIVDGNVQRVFARFYGERRQISQKDVVNFFWEKAWEWASAAKSPRIVNQALMELGATLCSKGMPACERCPLAAECVAFRKGWQLELPARPARRKTIDLWWAPLVLTSGKRFYLKQNLSGEWWSELWDFPRLVLTSEERAEAAVIDELTRWGKCEQLIPLQRQKHSVTHHRIHALPYQANLAKSPSVAEKKGKWVTKTEASKLALSSLAQKILSSSVLE